jgi:hypothetical protein
MPVYDPTTFRRLGSALAAAVAAVGIETGRIKAIGSGVAEITGSGVSVFWSSDSLGGEPAWLVRETWTVDGVQSSGTVATVPEGEPERAAKCAVLVVVERLLDAAISASRS